MLAIDEFIKKVDEIYGIYLDSTAGFFATRNNLINYQLFFSKRSSLSIEDLDKLQYTYGKGDPNKKESYSLHDCTQGLFKKRNEENGRNYVIIAGLCLVLIYQYWNDFFRKKIADEEGVEENNIKWNVMGDLKEIRKSIIHHRGIAVPEIKKCKVLNFFKEGDIIEIDKQQFEEIIWAIKNSKYEISSK